MTIYQATFKSGTQQFFEMDEEDARRLNQQWRTYREYEEELKLTGGYTDHNGKLKAPNPVFGSDTGATINVADLSGFQFYIPPEYAESRAYEVLDSSE